MPNWTPELLRGLPVGTRKYGYIEVLVVLESSWYQETTLAVPFAAELRVVLQKL